MKKILFVCTGNTCRSSMAEGLFNFLISKNPGLSDKFQAISAGIAATEGEPASSNAKNVLFDTWGIDISSHSAKNVNANIIKDAFLILTMTRAHKERIIDKYPFAGSKTHVLKEFIKNNGASKLVKSSFDISDPFGGSYKIYKSCSLEIKEVMDKLIAKLEKEFL
ncbi:MAG TPA: low molecular weight protein arginine phosphatase [Clostridiaceae bacterium]|jgi:protein-tyrosine phosphatase|nr:low molecular weight protein arginine phosphatase [Clostridiaceae bacterium]